MKIPEGTEIGPGLLEDTGQSHKTSINNIEPFPITGSVFINGATSFSGADIKVVVHVYDGGKAAQEQINNLIADLHDLNNQQISFLDRQSQLERILNTPNIVLDPNDGEELDRLNIGILSNANQIESVADEIVRLRKLKPKFSTKVLAEIQTLSVSTHREKFPVRGLGSVNPKSFTRGSRTIAGSMIFTVFDRNVLEEFLESHPSDFDAHVGATSALLDQIPPFDITVSFANELGQVSRMVIYGCEFVNEGQTMSIEDLLLENVVQYVARDIDPMRSIAKRKVDEANRLTQDMIATRGSSLLNDKQYKKYKELTSPFSRRFKTRANPFI